MLIYNKIINNTCYTTNDVYIFHDKCPLVYSSSNPSLDYDDKESILLIRDDVHLFASIADYTVLSLEKFRYIHNKKCEFLIHGLCKIEIVLEIIVCY